MSAARALNTKGASPISGTLIAEIAGPSGAGKSSVSAMLNKAGEHVTAGLTIWGLPVGLLAAGGCAAVPDIARLALERQRVDGQDLKQVVRLHAFARRLGREMAADTRDAIFMDEGVVFALAKLRADLGAKHMNRAMRIWERKMIQRWSRILDLIVWIDAPDEVLIDRIRTRAKRHRMKDRSAPEILRFLGDYRAAYRFVVSEMAANGKTRVVKIDGAGGSPERIASMILSDTLIKMRRFDDASAAAGGI